MKSIRLSETDTRAPKNLDKEAGKQRLQAALNDLSELQNLLMAEGKHAVLVIIQGMDASGKDGLIRHVFGAMNPQGVQVRSFKVPTAEEAAHDFLWRIHKEAPARGYIQVFNRSQYEDVLVPYVHGYQSLHDLKPQMEAINDFERLLTRHGNTMILKFFLHVSAGEQAERLRERMQDPRKMWKYNGADFEESQRRPQYYEVYEALFAKCGEVPWTIVPADQNWYKELVVAEALRDALQGLNMSYPGLKEVAPAS